MVRGSECGDARHTILGFLVLVVPSASKPTAEGVPAFEIIWSVGLSNHRPGLGGRTSRMSLIPIAGRQTRLLALDENRRAVWPESNVKVRLRLSRG